MSDILSAAELADMRAAVEELMPDTCNLLTSTYTPDGAGGGTLTWGTVSAAVACRLDIESGMEQIAGGAMQPFTRTVLSIPYDTTITNEYRVEHGGYIYNVKATNLDQSWPIVKRVELSRV
jgi:SPP1 family predicted phage head-tail adaptor